MVFFNHWKGKILCSIGFVLLLGCQEKTKNKQISLKEADQIIKNFTLIESSGGTISFKLEAKEAIIYDEKTKVRKVKLTFYKEGGVFATLIADSGILFNNTNDMEAIGNVQVITKDSVILYTEKLNWINEIGKIKTEDKVLIIKENKKIEGQYFESNPDLTEIKIKETYGTNY